MASDRMIGARIRARRFDRGLSQADLAKAAGISASYLNLIEHDKRRIGGRVLAAVADALGTDPHRLSEGAGPRLIRALTAAAAATESDPPPEIDQIERLAADLPGWTALIAAQSDRIAALEARIAAMGDRMAHDPALSASVHDVLSMVTAIRSSAAILVEEELEADWQRRFHRNIDEDSRRLATSAQALAGYLTAGEGAAFDAVSPQEEVEAWCAERGFAISGDMPVEGDLSEGARALLGAVLARAGADASRLPDSALLRGLEDGVDPFALASGAGVDPGLVMRRIATLPRERLGRDVGLVECDGAGAILFRRPTAGFDLPRYGAPCALWPIFQALLVPHGPRHDVVRQFGRDARPAETWCSVALDHPAGYGGPLTARATMLILPGAADDVPPTLGTTCRLCPRADCPARREAAIL